MRYRVQRFPAALLLILAGAGVAGAAGNNPKSYFREYQRVIDALREKSCRDALQPAIAFAESPMFSVTVSQDGQIEFLRAGARCAIDNQEDEIALKVADLWAARAPKERWPQVIRLYFGTQFERHETSLEALQVLASESPEDVREIELSFLNQLRRAASQADESGDQSLALYEALARAAYVPSAPYNDDFLRMGHGRLLLERGRVDEARARLATVTDIESVVQMRIERLFDRLRQDPAFEAHLDLKTAVERDIQRSSAAIDANPALMEAVYLHVSKLFVAQRLDAALALANSALARHAADPKFYGDADEYRKWLLNWRGYVLYGLGRSEEGGAMLREAAGLTEHGEPNVSNIINFALYLVDEGRAADAMALLPQIGQASPYGQSWIEAVRTCAGAQLGDDRERDQGLEYLKSHESDNPAALSRGLLCSNDLDGVAALMIRRLEDSDTRGDALLALQGRTESVRDGRTFRKLLLERFAVVRARADVRAAADVVGRIEDLPVNVGGDI
jgi:hypothetical protein